MCHYNRLFHRVTTEQRIFRCVCSLMIFYVIDFVKFLVAQDGFEPATQNGTVLKGGRPWATR